jgi:hypothetical protein
MIIWDQPGSALGEKSISLEQGGKYALQSSSADPIY